MPEGLELPVLHGGLREGLFCMSMHLVGRKVWQNQIGTWSMLRMRRRRHWVWPRGKRGMGSNGKRDTSSTAGGVLGRGRHGVGNGSRSSRGMHVPGSRHHCTTKTSCSASKTSSQTYGNILTRERSAEYCFHLTSFQHCLSISQWTWALHVGPTLGTDHLHAVSCIACHR